MSRIQYILPAVFAVGALALSSVFIVDEREQVLVLQFGQVKQEIRDPGLGFKIPFIQDVVRYEDRILGLQTQPLEVTLKDNRRLIVDAFTRWRITDLVSFREAVGPGGIDAAQARIDRIVNAAIREILGSVVSNAVLSEDRTGLMNRIRDIARREAADEIARGNEAASRLRAAADREVVEVTSDARRQAEVIRGEADASRNAIYAEAFGQDPEFFTFTRSLTAYERSMRDGNASIVMQPDSVFFDYLNDPNGRPAAPAQQ